MLEWIDAHPWALGYIVVPVVGWVLSLVAPRIVKRWPALAEPLDAIMHQLPAIPGAYAKLREAQKKATTVDLPGDKP